jgi:hypothetical protein
MQKIPDMDAVKEIIPIPASVESLEPFITAAVLLIDNVIIAQYPDMYSEDYLYEIARWLAAHFTAVRYTRTSSESIGSVSESYQNKVDLDLRCTMYGQQAIMLDYSGALAALPKKSVSITWLGKNE